ncbi:GTPase ObgE [Candidatus Izemoplasma sp. B36]|uniref:GTPase ObgE n=1 Tax=Candidatus Izemoplasma sp. B36 TaxID=3242468 RepID=UPI003558AE26
MFIDEVNVLVRSGKGGDGLISFRREKHVPLGGPSGGDGGKGGSVVFVADEGKSTLMDLKFQKHLFAKAGETGKTKNMKGADAPDIEIKVPLGTICYNKDTNEVLADLTKHGQRAVIARGGKGGRGNRSFATPRNKAPRIQENGEPAIELNIHVELKLLADVGIIGFPSVGKSTLITILSNSKPKIADYPFTTIVPNLGVVERPGINSFVLADMPGLIEGASKGLGLGHQFLKHIERTRVLIHMVDMSPESLRDPYEDYEIINNELKDYDYGLLERPQIIVASKMDMEGALERLETFKSHFDGDTKIIPISALTNDNLQELIYECAKLLEVTPFFYKKDEVIDDYVEYNFADEDKDILITKVKSDTYDVKGKLVQRLINRSNLMTEESIAIFLTKLRKAGLDEQLREAGAKNGDTVIIYDLELDFIE